MLDHSRFTSPLKSPPNMLRPTRGPTAMHKFELTRTYAPLYKKK
jgi:hypothetical protein